MLDFILWLKFTVLRGLVTEALPTPHPKENPTQFWFASRNMAVFTELEKVWYVKVNGKRLKVIPSDAYLDEYFTEVSLAFVVMGDGNWDRQTVCICTQNFTQADTLRFIKYLERRMGLFATPKKRKLSDRVGFVLRFRCVAKNRALLRKLVVPHIHPQMVYKLGPRTV